MNFVVTADILSQLCEDAAHNIATRYGSPLKVYGVPRGGVSAALALGGHLPMQLVDHPDAADIIFDDLIDSGTTLNRWAQKYPTKPFHVLIDKNDAEWKGRGFIVWPWEQSAEGSFEDNVVRLLQYVGENPARGGLAETPRRVARAWKDWCSGYGVDPKTVLKVFEDGGENYNQMITRKDIPIYSHCEHHLAPIIGKATISYIPNGRIVGLSKLDRLAEVFARRLQVQERLTQQIADSLQENLNPIGVGVWISARHLCVESRGVRHRSSDTITTALKGALLHDAAARAEFLSLAKS